MLNFPLHPWRMSTVQRLEVKSLRIDLKNFRTGDQKDEVSAARTMIATAPKNFWGLMDSLLDLDYLPTENIIVLKGQGDELVVREGNRRIACLKLVHGFISHASIEFPSHIQTKLRDKDSSWFGKDVEVPCIVFPAEDEALVDKIVSLTHGKGQVAGRDPWEAIARARHNRDMEGKNEPALDLFDKYLTTATNFTPDQADRWNGAYPITVLEEAMKNGFARFGCNSAKEVADKYPQVNHVGILNRLVYEVGQKLVETREFRDPNFFFERYGLHGPSTAPNGGATGSNGGATGSNGGATGSNGGAARSAPARNRGTRGAAKTAPLNDPKSVKKILRSFSPRGKEQQKLATLVDELKALKVEQTPHAFCFILRSIFEIAAKQYATKHGISLTKSGREKYLFDLLKEVTDQMVAGKPKMDPLVKKLHGALHELGNTHGILSVTSLNQLVHNTRFSAKAGDICIVFHNVFPLLEELAQ